MRLFDYIRFGLKNIWRQKARTVLTVFAIVIGATSVLAMLTIVFTAKRVVIGQIESIGALTQVTVSGNADVSSDEAFNLANGGGSDNVKLTDETVKKLAAIDHVQSAEPVLGAWQLRTATLKDDSSKRVQFNQVVGLNPGPANDTKLLAGRNLMPADLHNLVIGPRYLEKLGFKGNPDGILGKYLRFELKGYTGPGASIPKPPISMGSGGPDKDQWDAYNQQIRDSVTIIEAQVVGVLSSGVYDDQVFIPMKWAREGMINQNWQMEPTQPILDRNGRQIGNTEPKFSLQSQDFFDQAGYTSVVLKVDDTANVAAVTNKAKEMKLGAASAQEMIDGITKALTLAGLLLGAIGAISLLVAAIGVINTMVMATLERTREIGVLRACGATRATVRRLFTFEAALLGFWGGVFGALVAYGLVLLARQLGGTSLAAQGIDPSQVSIPVWLALVTIAATTVIGMLAGFFPAVRAARLNPVEALRYE